MNHLQNVLSYGFIIAIFLVGCNLTSGTIILTPKAVQPTLIPSKAKPTSRPANTQRFEDATLNITFNYPIGWQVEGKQGLITLWSNPETRGQSSSVPDGTTKIEFVMMGNSLDTEMQNLLSGSNVVSHEFITLTNEATAYQVSITGGMLGNTTKEIYLVQVGQNVFNIAAYGEQSPLITILNSLTTISR